MNEDRIKEVLADNSKYFFVKENISWIEVHFAIMLLYADNKEEYRAHRQRIFEVIEHIMEENKIDKFVDLIYYGVTDKRCTPATEEERKEIIIYVLKKKIRHSLVTMTPLIIALMIYITKDQDTFNQVKEIAEEKKLTVLDLATLVADRAIINA